MLINYWGAAPTPPAGTASPWTLPHLRDGMTHTPAGSRDALIAELQETMFRLLRAQRQVAEQAFAPLGLRPVQAFALALIGAEATHPKELAHQLDSPPSVVSGLIGDLEERGLLTRALDPSDRRRVRIDLTPEGVRTLEAIRQAWLEATSESVERLSSEDLETLVRIQRTLLEG